MSETEKRDVVHLHDSLVRNVLADTEIAADLLENYLPPELVSTLELDSLKREAGDTVSPKLLKREGDLRYSARFKGHGGELKVLLLCEHQSRPDRLMSFRMLEYVCAAYREHVPGLKKGKGFPYPLAVVLHHGESQWKKIPPMRELIDMTPDVPSDILGLPIYLIDAAAMSLDELRGHPMACALLDSLQSASTERLSERLMGILGRLKNVREKSRRNMWSLVLSNYYTAVQGKTQKSVDTLFQALKALHGTREAEKMTATIADGWKEEGRVAGIAEGRVAGIAEGVVKGKVESVLDVLESRFSEVPAGIQKKLMNLKDVERIGKITKLAATCQSLKDFQKEL